MAEYRSFEEFYPFYLSEHSNRTCRRLHFVGSTVALALVVATFATRSWWLFALAIAAGYGFAWIGHGFFERNRPATFTHPIYSFIGDWVMWRDMMTGRIRF
jgi:hypothetical protein